MDKRYKYLTIYTKTVYFCISSTGSKRFKNYGDKRIVQQTVTACFKLLLRNLIVLKKIPKVVLSQNWEKLCSVVFHIEWGNVLKILLQIFEILEINLPWAASYRGRSVPRAVTGRLVATECRVQSTDTESEPCDEKCALWQVYFRAFWFQITNYACQQVYRHKIK